MNTEEQKKTKDIQLILNQEHNELMMILTKDGVKYLQKVLNHLQDAETYSHWHIDEFDEWLGGDFQHLIVIKEE